LKPLRRVALRLTVVIAAAMVSVGLLAAPASAHPITGTTWAGAHEICQSCSINQGNLVGMWQGILVSSIGGLDCGSVDGQFGPNTTARTRMWQAQARVTDPSVTVDGRVGPKTWGHAFANTAFDHSAAGFAFYRFNGGHGNVWFRRNLSTNVWEFAAGIGLFLNTNHPAISGTLCIGLPN
jgi:peptidoglycan hydrolase-like protein with peptidoglycan-binding domain